MFAILETGSKQYKVEEGDILEVELLDKKIISEDNNINFDSVLLVKDTELHIGQPFVKNARISAAVLEEFKAPKVIIFKKKSKKQYRKTRGHRQKLLRIRIDKIEIGVKPETKPAVKAEPKKETKAKPAAAAKAKTETVNETKAKPAAKTTLKAKAEPVKTAKAAPPKEGKEKETKAKTTKPKTGKAKETKAKTIPKAKADAGKETKAKTTTKAKAKPKTGKKVEKKEKE
ncbi:MAG: 50S ribosomal protein L21 [Candidatus Aminicenantes bacterium]|nr:50S ribosomal protein L21 [Candidatus Aminicenantes bacterium]